MTTISGGIMKCCTCFKNVRNYTSLHQTVKQSSTAETETTTTYENILQYLLKFRSPLDGNNLISQKVCNKCASLLKSVYRFIVKVHELNEELHADLMMNNGDCMKETLIEMPPASNDDMLIKMEIEQSMNENVSEMHEKNHFPLNFDEGFNNIHFDKDNAKDIHKLQNVEHSNANDHLEVSLQVEMPRKMGDDEETPFHNEDDDLQIKKEDSFESNEELKSNNGNGNQAVKKKKSTKAKSNERSKSKSQDNNEMSLPVPNDLPRRCNICDKVYDNAAALRTHKKYTHMPDERKMSCPLCSFKSSRNSNLKVHLKKVHKLDSVSPYLTTRKYNQKIQRKTLQKHIMDGKTKRDLYAETCLCTFCGKSFSSKYFLKTHVRRHTGERPYKCDLCEKSFTRNDELRSHRVIHSDEKPHQCKVCDKSFKRPDKLRTHMRVHSENRPYKCSECEKTFKYAHVLKTHMYIHTGQRPFQCASCGETFSLRTSFNLHCSKYNHAKFLNNTL